MNGTAPGIHDRQEIFRNELSQMFPNAKAARSWIEMLLSNGDKNRATDEFSSKVIEKTDAGTLRGFVSEHVVDSTTVIMDKAYTCKDIPRNPKFGRHSVGEFARYRNIRELHTIEHLVLIFSRFAKKRLPDTELTAEAGLDRVAVV